MTIIRRVFDGKVTPVLAVMCIVLFAAESRWQLRKRTQRRMKRVFTNSIVSLPAFSLLRFFLLPVMVKLAIKNRHTQFGLAYHIPAHPAVRNLLVFLLLDYTNYCWHLLLHKLPFLWRFHLVHHCDPDLDLTTAFRFHFGELIGSVFYRGAAVKLIGASPAQVLVYEAVFEAATQFHHTNLKLPYKFEKLLSHFIVTPRMHGIHHSIRRQETDSNYSVIFSCWDRLHRTMRLNAPGDTVVTGVPSYSNAEELSIPFLWKLPFTAIRPWIAIEEGNDAGGRQPDREINPHKS